MPVARAEAEAGFRAAAVVHLVRDPILRRVLRLNVRVNAFLESHAGARAAVVGRICGSS